MAGVTAKRVSNELSSYNLRLNRIIRIPQRRIAPLTVYLLNISNNGMIAEYRVRIGEFRVYVKVLNLHIKAIVKSANTGKGSFGTILEKSVAMQEFVTKVQWRHINREQIEDLVREVAISKVCSVFEVGPAIETSIPFDVVVYADAVQFHLEKCNPLSKSLLMQYE
jgi:hypothetical protein